MQGIQIEVGQIYSINLYGSVENQNKGLDIPFMVFQKTKTITYFYFYGYGILVDKEHAIIDSFNKDILLKPIDKIDEIKNLLTIIKKIQNIQNYPEFPEEEYNDYKKHIDDEILLLESTIIRDSKYFRTMYNSTKGCKLISDFNDRLFSKMSQDLPRKHTLGLPSIPISPLPIKTQSSCPSSSDSCNTCFDDQIDDNDGDKDEYEEDKQIESIKKQIKQPAVKKIYSKFDHIQNSTCQAMQNFIEKLENFAYIQNNYLIKKDNPSISQIPSFCDRTKNTYPCVNKDSTTKSLNSVKILVIDKDETKYKDEINELFTKHKDLLEITCRFKINKCFIGETAIKSNSIVLVVVADYRENTTTSKLLVGICIVQKQYIDEINYNIYLDMICSYFTGFGKFIIDELDNIFTDAQNIVLRALRDVYLYYPKIGFSRGKPGYPKPLLYCNPNSRPFFCKQDINTSTSECIRIDTFTEFENQFITWKNNLNKISIKSLAKKYKVFIKGDATIDLLDKSMIYIPIDSFEKNHENDQNGYYFYRPNKNYTKPILTNKRPPQQIKRPSTARRNHSSSSPSRIVTETQSSLSPQPQNTLMPNTAKPNILKTLELNSIVYVLFALPEPNTSQRQWYKGTIMKISKLYDYPNKRTSDGTHYRYATIHFDDGTKPSLNLFDNYYVDNSFDKFKDEIKNESALWTMNKPTGLLLGTNIDRINISNTIA